MADETLVTWDLANWITVTLMVGVSFTIAGFLVKIWLKSKGAQQANG